MLIFYYNKYEQLKFDKVKYEKLSFNCPTFHRQIFIKMA